MDHLVVSLSQVWDEMGLSRSERSDAAE